MTTAAESTAAKRALFTRVLRRSNLRLAFFVARRDVQGVGPHATQTIVVKGTYTLAPGEVAKAVDAKEQPHLVGDLYYDDDPTQTLRYPTDFAPFKPRADVLLVGSVAQFGPVRVEARRGGRVEFGVGSRTKVLAIAGDRVWQNGIGGAVPGKPDTLRTLALRYENAFGGVGYAMNPVGRGFIDKTTDPEGQPLPAIELESALVRSTNDAPRPAGFGPLDYTWAERHAFAGTYDERWRRERWPWYPTDFDWAYYNAAPPDQQIQGYLKGDERFHFSGIHPRVERFESRLPGVRPRVFARRRATAAGDVFNEIPVVLDTMWVDADALTMSLVWRGSIRIESMRSREIEAILVVDESLNEAPKPASIYAEDSYWKPDEPSEEELADEEEAAARGPASQVYPEEGVDEAAALAEARAMLEQGAVSPALIEKLSKVSSIDAFLEILNKESEPKPEDVKKLDDLLANAESEGAAELQSKGHDPEALKTQKAREDAAAPRVVWTRDRVIVALEKKESLRDADLSGLDLSGLDFTERDLARARLDEANLEGSIFDRADLAEASLRAARAEKASFADAVLEGAYCVDAVLKAVVAPRANLGRIRARGANLEGAMLALADLTDAELEGAKLVGADLSDATFDKVNLRDAKASKCVADRASFRAADLTRADFADASLYATTLTNALLDKASFARIRGAAVQLGGARGDRVDFTAADLAEVRASGCTLTSSKLDEVKADASNWVGSTLSMSSFRGASLERADFTDAALETADFHFVRMRGANFSYAKLGAAKLTKVNLFQSRLEGADLRAADCRGSNFFNCDFTEAQLEHARFDKSNVKRTILDRAASSGGGERR